MAGVTKVLPYEAWVRRHMLQNDRHYPKMVETAESYDHLKVAYAAGN